MKRRRHASAATPALTSLQPGSASAWLALAYAALVLYASLYPFAGWRWPPGQSAVTLATLTAPVYQNPFDITANLLGYLPLGLLTGLALRRRGVGAALTAALTVVLLTLLSYVCEVTQHFIPGRVPSLVDLALNAAGAALGALLGLALHTLGVVRRWHALRQRWFSGEGAFVLALLMLWPVALLFPAPVPLGLGQIGERLREALVALLDGVPWAADAHALLAAAPVAAAPLRPLAEIAIVAAGLLGPCLLAYALIEPGWRRALVALGALALGTLGMSLSTLLNFGPRHVWTWLTPASVWGLAIGLLTALLLVALRRRLVPGLALIALTALVVGVAQAPADPYFAQSLQAWEQGRFVCFHGLAQWVGWLWPYAAMGWLLARLGRGG